VGIGGRNFGMPSLTAGSRLREGVQVVPLGINVRFRTENLANRWHKHHQDADNHLPPSNSQNETLPSAQPRTHKVRQVLEPKIFVYCFKASCGYLNSRDIPSAARICSI